MVFASKISPTSSEIANELQRDASTCLRRVRLSPTLSAYRNFRRSTIVRGVLCYYPTDVWGRLACFLQSFARLVSPAGTTIPSDLRCFIIHAPSSRAEICLSFLRPSSIFPSGVFFCLRIHNGSADIAKDSHRKYFRLKKN